MVRRPRSADRFSSKLDKEIAMKSISVVSVPVADPERAKNFYIDKLGFTLIADATFGDGLRWLQVGIAGAQTSLTLVTWFEEMPAGSLRGLVIDCDDIERTYRTLIERGVVFHAPPAEQPGGLFAMLSDPDGNVLALHQADA
jgi:predicted enzyme related to lactoylglutathione lyase